MKDKEINSQPFKGMNFTLLHFKEQVVLLILLAVRKTFTAETASV